MQPDEDKRAARNRVELKLSPDQKKLISAAAALNDQSVAEFIRQAAERAASEALKKTHS